MSKQLYISIIAFLFCTHICSQSISGVVSLGGTASSIPGMNIIINDGQYHDVSDANGAFKFENLPEGTYTVKVSGIGYKPWIDTINYIENALLTLNIEVTEDIIDLPIVEVNAHSSTGGKMGSMKLPGSSHYISARELKEINSTNPNDILARIPGVQIQEEDGFGLRPNIGLRGTGSERSSRITIMEDGVLAAPAPYAAPSAYYFPTIARMQGVEVKKGSSQINYGPYTTGGVINFLSTPIPQEFSGRVRLGTGSFGSRNLHAHIGDSKGQLSYGLEAFQYSSNGFKDIDFSDSDTGFDKKDYLAKIRWTSKASNMYQSLQFKIGESREHSDETYLGLSYNDFLNDPYRRYAASQMDEMNTNHRQMSLHYIVNPISSLYIQATAYRNTFSRNWYKLDKVINDLGEKLSINQLVRDPQSYSNGYDILTGSRTSASESLLVKANNRSYLSEGIQAKANYETGDHQLEWGIRIHRDEMDRFQWLDGYSVDSGIMELESAGVKGTESNRIESASAIASYLNYIVTYGKFKFNLGLRMEDITIRRDDYGKEDPERNGTNLNTRTNEIMSWIPGWGFQYEIDETSQLFGGIHKGFSPPGSSPETSPESSINYELGYRIMNNTTFASIVVFLNDYDNLLGSDLAASGGIGTGDQFNGGEAAARGLELAFSTRKVISDHIWIPVEFQYTFTDARFNNEFESEFEAWGSVQNGDFLPYIAPHVWSLSSGIKSGNWGIVLSANYMDDMRIVAGKGSTKEDQAVDNRLLLSLNVNYALSQNSDISIGVHNLTDRQYAVASRPAGWRPGAPRNIVLGLEARF